MYNIIFRVSHVVLAVLVIASWGTGQSDEVYAIYLVGLFIANMLDAMREEKIND